MSNDELARLRAYSRQFVASQPTTSTCLPPAPPEDLKSAFRRSVPSDNNANTLGVQLPNSTITQSAGVDGGRAPTGRSSNFQDIHAVDAIHNGLSLTTLGSSMCGFHDDDDDDDDWEDKTDPVTFVRGMAAGNPHPIITKFLEDHDREERVRFESKIASWATGITGAAEESEF
jgi:hypothetical protein